MPWYSVSWEKTAGKIKDSGTLMEIHLSHAAFSLLLFLDNAAQP